MVRFRDLVRFREVGYTGVRTADTEEVLFDQLHAPIPRAVSPGLYCLRIHLFCHKVNASCRMQRHNVCSSVTRCHMPTVCAEGGYVQLCGRHLFQVVACMSEPRTHLLSKQNSTQARLVIVQPIAKCHNAAAPRLKHAEYLCEYAFRLVPGHTAASALNAFAPAGAAYFEEGHNTAQCLRFDMGT